ncbi:hypothetical protein BDZ94DRAFT_1259514 [Collybia nuda]|uniref:Uncharacterized protein n=1 Tax=Collybia nuda TaxID=64659 RepID=A0A9P5Y5X3_9AGAR|nr:hypothetical protein BDZ94DRAFT_1259514 [Collybia nuda]
MVTLRCPAHADYCGGILISIRLRDSSLRLAPTRPIVNFTIALSSVVFFPVVGARGKTQPDAKRGPHTRRRRRQEVNNEYTVWQ